MARRRSQATTEILAGIVRRLGPALAERELEWLRIRLDLPEFDGEPDEAAVAAALSAMRARRSFAQAGASELTRTLPALRSAASAEGSPAWTLGVTIPILDDGRMDLRIDAAPSAEAAAILDGMAERADPSWRLAELRLALDVDRDRVNRALGKAVERLREQVRRDLNEIGADAVTYIAHLDRSLRSRRFAFDPDLARTLGDALKPVRGRARVVAQENSRQRRLRDRIGFGAYIDRFVAARRLNRRIVFHMGPTNSGKTYAALDHLAKASTGSYLAPLRLLALENYETLLERGLRAGMITGEEVLGEADPSHTSRTIETADLRRPVDVAVIDEIQMIMDPDRGWAWTNALFGIPARVVVVCGSEDALSYVRRAAEAADESLDVVTFTRKTPLRLIEQPEIGRAHV